MYTQKTYYHQRYTSKPTRAVERQPCGCSSTSSLNDFVFERQLKSLFGTQWDKMIVSVAALVTERHRERNIVGYREPVKIDEVQPIIVTYGNLTTKGIVRDRSGNIVTVNQEQCLPEYNPVQFPHHLPTIIDTVADYSRRRRDLVDWTLRALYDLTFDSSLSDSDQVSSTAYIAPFSFAVTSFARNDDHIDTSDNRIANAFEKVAAGTKKVFNTGEKILIVGVITTVVVGGALLYTYSKPFLPESSKKRR